MRGIILAGGRATRLFPLTYGISKQLLPVYKQPMVFYPLKTLIDMGITEILVIVASEFQKAMFLEYLGNGKKFGVNLSYVVQEKPNGISEAFIIGKDFIGKDDVVLILGDNILLANGDIDVTPNTIFTYKVKDPSAYGVVEVDELGYMKNIVEKPQTYVSDDAVIGLYIFSNSVVDLVKEVKPSKRGELEITDLIRLMNDKEGIGILEFDGVWFDCGTHDDLLECAEYVRALDKRTNRDIFLKEKT